MERQQEGQEDALGTSPAAATDVLEQRVDELLTTFRARTPVPDDVFEALRAGIVSLARQHAAETVHVTITARAAKRADKHQRRPWGRRP